jgi:7-cyano-7-deazaguanine synthase
MVAGALARAAGYRLFALTIDYNQRHRIELQAAARVAAMLGVERHIILPLDLSQFGGSALTDKAIAVPKSVCGTGLGRGSGRARSCYRHQCT